MTERRQCQSLTRHGIQCKRIVSGSESCCRMHRNPRPDASPTAATTVWSNTSEKEFQATLTELALLTGWKVYHTRDSRGSHAGFPDLVLVRPPDVIFAELKARAGRLRPDQYEWSYRLLRCSDVKYYLWRPDDWPAIEETLR